MVGRRGAFCRAVVRASVGQLAGCLVLEKT